MKILSADHDIFYAGYRCCKRGGSCDDNPHTDPANRELWHQGFIDCLDDLEADDPAEDYLNDY